MLSISNCFLFYADIRTKKLHLILFLIHICQRYLSPIPRIVCISLFPIYHCADRWEDPFIEASSCDDDEYLQIFVITIKMCKYLWWWLKFEDICDNNDIGLVGDFLDYYKCYDTVVLSILRVVNILDWYLSSAILNCEIIPFDHRLRLLWQVTDSRWKRVWNIWRNIATNSYFCCWT